ncbi:MAG: hypoxanthine phosphoribosyltransferase [Oscillospiraceae bacterium]|jgi:hypoxanthine phosphoribosyltransferase|nr:hypoxanthine phosphoribosyltransferase [Oscillospiraceae bacterium]
MNADVESVYYSQEQIQARVAELGRRLEEFYTDKNPIFLCVLKGGCVFFADLIRACAFPLETRFIKASSYRDGVSSSGMVDISGDAGTEIAGRHIVIVEDILDTGITLKRMRAYLEELGPASVSICVLLDKKERRVETVDADYIGFSCDNLFFVGYGLDYAEKYRNLPYVGVLKPEIYS